MNTFIKYLILPSITAFVVLTFILSNLKNNRIEAEKKNEKNIESVQEESVMYDKLINFGKNNNFVYPSDNIRDPFKKVTPNKERPQIKHVLENEPTIKLSGIIKGKDSPLAIIKTQNNSYIAKAGEKINDIQILSIQEKSIKIMRNGKIEHIQLWVDR